MKQQIFYAMMAVSLCVGMTACSDDDEEDVVVVEVENVAEAVAGSYSGYTLASCAYFSDDAAADQVITVTAVTETTVNVSYISDTWGTFTIEGATVTQSGTTYTITGSGITMMGMSESSISSYDCTLTASIESGKTSPSFVFSVPTVMGGLTITFYEGVLPVSAINSNND